MIVKLSDWLISMLRLHRFPAVICVLRFGATPVEHRVRLASVNADRSTNTITVVFTFVDNLDAKLNMASIVVLNHFAGYIIVNNANVIIPSEYKWGQVALVETIKLIGAV